MWLPPGIKCSRCLPDLSNTLLSVAQVVGSVWGPVGAAQGMCEIRNKIRNKIRILGVHPYESYLLCTPIWELSYSANPAAFLVMRAVLAGLVAGLLVQGTCSFGSTFRRAIGKNGG